MDNRTSPSVSSDDIFNQKTKSPRLQSTFGILSDRETDEVPGTVKLLSHSNRNEPLGEGKTEHHRSANTSSPTSQRLPRDNDEDAKRTADGKIVLNPQPEDSPNDPLNWPSWRRDCALLSLGFYCMLGGGMTPILAAGFNQVARTYDVSYSQVALTTGLYMMGLGVGSVIWSPTAILYGKRPVYLASSVLFVLSGIWCAASPNYASLVVARVFQGIAVSPVECLPSATIAEIFFLHERAFRVGIYTLLLLGGKNLIPLVSAAIIQSKGWRWVFWIIAIIVGFGGALLFLFVPETFWDRTPRPRRTPRVSLSQRLSRSLRPSISRRSTSRSRSASRVDITNHTSSRDAITEVTQAAVPSIKSPTTRTPKHSNVHFAMDEHRDVEAVAIPPVASNDSHHQLSSPAVAFSPHAETIPISASMPSSPMHHTSSITAIATEPDVPDSALALDAKDAGNDPPGIMRYTTGLRRSPAKSYVQTLRPWNGRLSQENWFKVGLRPFVLYAYPSVLWSSMVYALSVGWLIVLSESVAHIYENVQTYNFSSIEVGLVYVSPFVGGILGTAVAGKFSDVIVRFMARRNDGIYEPEFRLVMAIPIGISTAVGLMGFGWSVEERDNFMVPTIFFGIISFGCCMGSTTAITFCVDSYRQFAAEALVTLNFSKNILHGLVWSLFFPHWLQSSGPKLVFLVIGGIQIACLLLTIPMYIYGKRARMWTVRTRMMEKL